jgi:predicted membrane protein
MNLKSYTFNLGFVAAFYESFRAALPLVLSLFLIYTFNYFGLANFSNQLVALSLLWLSELSLIIFALLSVLIGIYFVCYNDWRIEEAL